MHKFIESKTGVGYDDLTELDIVRPMAEKVIEITCTVEEYYARKSRCIILRYMLGLLTCLNNGLETIVDFKQINRPKRKEWVEDYYLQIATDVMAHDYVHGQRSVKV